MAELRSGNSAPAFHRRPATRISMRFTNEAQHFVFKLTRITFAQMKCGFYAALACSSYMFFTRARCLPFIYVVFDGYLLFISFHSSAD
jgi:hypothetical protein